VGNAGNEAWTLPTSHLGYCPGEYGTTRRHGEPVTWRWAFTAHTAVVTYRGYWSAVQIRHAGRQGRGRSTCLGLAKGRTSVEPEVREDGRGSARSHAEPMCRETGARGSQTKHDRDTTRERCLACPVKLGWLSLARGSSH